MTFSFVVERIPAAGLDVSHDLPREWVSFALGELMWPMEDSSPLRLTLARQGTNVTVDGEIALSYGYRCSRCAEEASAQMRVPIQLAFVEGDEDSQEEGELDVWGVDADHEMVLYTGPNIELETSIIEQLVFALPSYPVCRADCKGLCPECGENLNESSCQCTTERVDPRWAKLKDIKL